MAKAKGPRCLRALSLLAAASAAAALSVGRPCQRTRTMCPTAMTADPPSTVLRLGPTDDVSDYGRKKQSSELDSLISKRDAIRQKKVANTKPDDDTPPMEEMTDEEIQALFDIGRAEGRGGGGGGGSDGDESGEAAEAGAAATGGLDIDDLFSKDYVPDFKTRRSGSSRGLSSGAFGDNPPGGSPSVEGDEEAGGGGLFVDWTEDYDDENEFHIPNRIGFTTNEWGDAKKGFVSGKLKRKERRAGKFNKTDLRKAFDKLQQNGISFVEASESNPLAEAFLRKFAKDCDYGNNERGALVASTFPNPWKHALQSRSLPRRGAKAIVTAAEQSCDRMGVPSMALYQVQNPWYYPGGTTALAEGLLDAISDDHTRYVGCANVPLGKVARLQGKLRAQGEFVATSRFEFSLTNRGAMADIAACRKIGVTPVCTNVLDGGLATGRYTSTNPTGGELSKGEGDTGPYPVRRLEKLDALFKVQAGLIEKVNRRIGDRLMKYDSGQAPKINRDITTTQVAINYVRAKGAVPLVSVNNVKTANELLGCLGWDLSEEEVEELDKACKSCGV